MRRKRVLKATSNPGGICIAGWARLSGDARCVYVELYIRLENLRGEGSERVCLVNSGGTFPIASPWPAGGRKGKERGGFTEGGNGKTDCRTEAVQYPSSSWRRNASRKQDLPPFAIRETPR